MMHLLSETLDKTSLALTAPCVFLMFTGGILGFLSAVAVVSTIIYNTIRIYKEVKDKK
jgi:hypothetical protein